MESSCDSDPYSVQTLPPDESDIEIQLLAEQENDNKQDIIDNLQKELSICRAQFEQSTAINKKIEAVHNKNQKLTAALQNLQSEKEELARRLEISIKANEELESKLNDERFTSSQLISRESTDKEREIAKLKKEYDGTIETMTTKIETLEKNNENLELNNKMLSNRIDRILQNSNQYFGFTFSDIDLLIEFLLQPRINEPKRKEEPDDNININNNQNTILILEKKNCILKQKLKESRQLSRKLIKSNEQITKKLQEVEKSKNLLSKDYKYQIEQLKEDDLNDISQLKDTINNLNSKIEKLKKDNQTLKTEIKEIHTSKVTSLHIDTVSESSIQIDPPDSKKCNHIIFKEELDVLNKRNQELEQKVQLFEEKNDQLQSKLKEIQESKNKLEVQIENQNVELNSLKVVHDETLNEVTTLRESLHNKYQNPPKKPTNKKLLPKLKMQLDHYQKKNQLLCQQIHELQIQNESEKREKNFIESNLISLKNELEEARANISSLTEELSITRQQNDDKPSPMTADDFIPPYAWRFCEFDPNLNERIEKVTINPLLQPATKLNSVYKVIQKYIDEIIKQKDDNIQNFFEENQNLKTKVNKFIVDFSILLSLNPVTISDFINCKGDDTIIQKLTQFVQDHENMKRKEALFSSLFEMLVKTFDKERSLNLNEVSIQSFISNLKNQTVLLSQKLTQKCQKLRTLKSVLKEVKKSSDDQISNLKSDLNKHKNELIQIKKNNDMLTEMNQKLKRELHTSRKNYSELQQKSEEKESLLQDECERKINNAQSTHNKSEQSLKKQLDILLKDNQNDRSTIESYETTVSHLRSVIEKNQQELVEKEKLIVKLTAERELNSKQIEEKFRIEKAQIIKSYEKAISDIKKEFDDSRRDLERLSNDLLSCQKKNKNSKDSIVRLKREKMRLENEIKCIYEQVKRDRQLKDAETNNKIMSAETNFSKKINDYKIKIENEKKRIFSYAANEFRQFFNPSEIIDEKSFRCLLSRIKKEYDKLFTSDANVRRLVGASPHQPTEEAVAHVVTC